LALRASADHLELGVRARRRKHSALELQPGRLHHREALSQVTLLDCAKLCGQHGLAEASALLALCPTTESPRWPSGPRRAWRALGAGARAR